MSTKLHFKISSGLKNIIGKDLITDEFVAVFELVKNSYDAGANLVTIKFEGLTKKNPAIFIEDNGKGMNLTDLTSKWLFVAHSAKRTGEEDYRDKIKTKRYYAGAKGIGRFSCDRLGRKLLLTSLRKESSAKVEILDVDWNDFYNNSKVEFKDIPIKHSNSQRSEFPYDSGTILNISILNDLWDRKKILELKTSLSKLIIPSLNQSKDEHRPFDISVIAQDELAEDELYKKQCKIDDIPIDPKKLVNGPVHNFVFESLNLKTTQILSEFTKDKIKTTLTDRGKFIYEIVEKNPLDALEQVNFHLFFLNQASKANFTKIMGIQPINYGNIFIYKNGFRVMPYGNERDDSLGIDARHSQGFRRFLGTRSLIGRVEISGDNPDLRETSSRDGGLIKNYTYIQFIEGFFKTLRRLEKYVVDTKDWGVDDEFLRDFEEELSKEQVVKLLSNLSSEKDIISIKYNDDILEIVNEQQSNSATKIIKNFKRIGFETKNEDLVEKANTLEKKLNILTSARIEAEIELENRAKDFEVIKRQLDASNKYLLSTVKDINTDGLALVHHIEHETSKLSPKVDSLIRNIQRGNMDFEKIIEKLSEIKLHADKVMKVSKLITRSNFNLLVNEQKANLVTYISEYLSLHSEINHTDSFKLSIENDNISFDYRFSPINVSIIFDNLILNSVKANASKALLKFETTDKGLKMLYSDDGKGVQESIIENMFRIGVTTTNGSGIGLFTVNDLLSKMGGKITFLGNGLILKGATFEIIF